MLGVRDRWAFQICSGGSGTRVTFDDKYTDNWNHSYRGHYGIKSMACTPVLHNLFTTEPMRSSGGNSSSTASLVTVSPTFG